MAEQPNFIVNGGDGDRTAENETLGVEGDATKPSDQDRKIEELEHEKSELIADNETYKDQVQVLTDEIDVLRRNDAEMNRRMDELKIDYEKYEEDKKALSAIAVQAAKLEGEVFRLQSDLITAMSESESTAVELRMVKAEYETLRQMYAEKELKVRSLEQERAMLIVGIDREAEKARQAMIDSEMRIRYSEDNVLVIEELKIENIQLQSDKKKSESLISSLKEAFDTVKEKAARLESEIKERDLKVNNAGAGKGLEGLEFPWPVALVSAGTVAAAAAVVIYIGYSKQR
ncbi:hypothetical protein Syun_028476 [Stephania yunnanensis]|uniref:Uncharacterized protein n=1 Tax=Stephania yunnanensis TaxID=152371 RepID=A0AAP0EHF4_9MAGN